jgi:hypothetical protein
LPLADPPPPRTAMLLCPLPALQPKCAPQAKLSVTPTQ